MATQGRWCVAIVAAVVSAVVAYSMFNRADLHGVSAPRAVGAIPFVDSTRPAAVPLAPPAQEQPDLALKPSRTALDPSIESVVIVGTAVEREDESQPVDAVEAAVFFSLADARSRKDPVNGPVAWTHEDGRFELRDIRPSQRFYLRLSKAGYRPAVPPRLGPFEVGRHEIGKVSLSPSAGIHGVVTDEAGGPIGSAIVSLIEESPMFGRAPSGARPDTARRSVSVDGNGRYSIECDAKVFSLRAEADGYAAQRTAELAADGLAGREVNFRLRSSTPFEGRVVDHLAQGVARATVRVEEIGSGDRGFWQQIASDVEGRFVIPFAPIGSLRVSVERIGFAPTCRVVAAPVKDLVITLDQLGSVTGRLSRHADGSRPMSVEWVLVAADESVFRFTDLRLDAEERFTCNELPVGTYALLAFADDLPLAVSESIVVNAGATTDVGLVGVGRSRVVQGRVRYGSGAPASGARVAVLVARAVEYRTARHAGPILETGGDGWFEHSAVPMIRCELLAAIPGYYCEGIQLEATTDTDPVHLSDLVLLQNAEIEGTVRDRLGAPVAGREVRVQQRDVSLARITSATGRFRFDELRAGVARVTVVATTTSDALFRDVTLAAGEAVVCDFHD